MAYILTQKLNEMSETQFKKLFIRYNANSIIQATGVTYQPNSAFNAGANCFGEDILLPVRMEDLRGISHPIAVNNRDCITKWRINPDLTMVDNTNKYPRRGYGTKS